VSRQPTNLALFNIPTLLERLFGRFHGFVQTNETFNGSRSLRNLPLLEGWPECPPAMETMSRPNRFPLAIMAAWTIL
jgi:hypothetical protein